MFVDFSNPCEFGGHFFYPHRFKDQRVERTCALWIQGRFLLLSHLKFVPCIFND